MGLQWTFTTRRKNASTVGSPHERSEMRERHVRLAPAPDIARSSGLLSEIRSGRHSPRRRGIQYAAPLGSNCRLWNTGSSGQAGRRRRRLGHPFCPSFGIASGRKIRLEQARNAVPATNRQWFWPRFGRPKGLAMLIRSEKHGVRGGAAKGASMSAPVSPAATAPTLLLGGLLLLIGP